MIDIIVTIHNRIASAPYDARIVSNNTDYTITFDFDEEWAETERTARFSFSEGYVDVPFSGNTVTVPSIPSTAHELRVGVYAGSLHTTSSAVIKVVPSCLCGDEVEYIPADDTGIPDATELELADTVRITDVSEGKPVKATLEQLKAIVGGVNFELDETLSLQGGVLKVNTADRAQEDNTLPITSAAVHTAVGNIEILLAAL